MRVPRRDWRLGDGRPSSALVLGLGVVVVLAGCQGSEQRLEGEREAVLPERAGVSVDPGTAQASFNLPAPQANTAWPQVGYNAANRVPHVRLGEQLEAAWQAQLGSGNQNDRRLATRPVVAQGRVFTLDTSGRVAAHKLATGERIWRRGIAAAAEKGLFGVATPYQGGGLAVADGHVYAAGAHGQLVQLDAESGTVGQRRSLPAPVHAAPKLARDRLLLRTVDNRLLAYGVSAKGLGSRLWQHQDVAEPAQLLGGGAPAFAAGRVVAAYSTGNLFGLTGANGRSVWQHNLRPTDARPGGQSINEIGGGPVLADDTAYAVSYGGVTAGVALDTGQERWRLPVGGRSRVQLMGDYLALVTNKAVALGVDREQGQVRWRHELQRFADPQNSKDRLAWFGPVLAGGRLWFASSHGKLVALSPASGTEVARVDLGGQAVSPPVVADETLLILTADGMLRAYR